MTDIPLFPVQKERVMVFIENALRAERPELFDGSHPIVTTLADIEARLDVLVDIARRSTADRIEPYLAQLLDDVCEKCPRQHSSGFCPARYEQECVLYRHAATIFKAIEQALTQMADPSYCAVHGLPTGPVTKA